MLDTVSNKTTITYAIELYWHKDCFIIHFEVGQNFCTIQDNLNSEYWNMKKKSADMASIANFGRTDREYSQKHSEIKPLQGSFY